MLAILLIPFYTLVFSIFDALNVEECIFNCIITHNADTLHPAALKILPSALQPENVIQKYMLIFLIF